MNENYDPLTDPRVQRALHVATQVEAENDRASLASRAFESVNFPYKVGKFALSNWRMAMMLLAGGTAAVLTVGDLVRVPPEKSVKAEGALQAIWSVNEIDVSLTSSFTYASVEGDGAAFEPLALIEGMPLTAMKYTPEGGRYISFEKVHDEALGDYVRVAEYDRGGNIYPLAYENVLFQTILPEECAIETRSNGEVKPDGSCTDPNDPRYRGLIDHDIVYSGYPLAEDRSIVEDAEAGYAAVIQGTRNCIARITFGGADYSQDPSGTRVVTENPKLAYYNIQSAIKAIMANEVSTNLGLPMFNERGIRTVLFPEDEKRLRIAVEKYGADVIKKATPAELNDIFGLDKSPLPIPVELKPFNMGPTAGQLLIDLKNSTNPHLTLPDGLNQETAFTHPINDSCVPSSDKAKQSRIKNHDFANEFGGTMVGVPFKLADGTIMNPDVARKALQDFFGSGS